MNRLNPDEIKWFSNFSNLLNDRPTSKEQLVNLKQKLREAITYLDQLIQHEESNQQEATD